MSRPSIAVVADALVAELNDPARGWAQAFTAERRWIERKPSKELKEMQVTVMVAMSTQGLYSRCQRQRSHEILIVFRKDVNPAEPEAIDSLATFVETVADYYGANAVTNGARKVAGTQAIVTAVLVDPIIAPDELDTNRRFFSVLTLTVLEIANVAAVPDAQTEAADTDGGPIEIIEIPPFGGTGETGLAFRLLENLDKGLLVFVLHVFGKSGGAAMKVTFGDDAAGIGNTPMTQDASIDLPSLNVTLKIFSLPVVAGNGFLVVDLAGDTAALAGHPLSIKNLPSGVRNAVNLANGSAGGPVGDDIPHSVATSSTTNEAVIAAFSMVTADKVWAWTNGYTGGFDYVEDFGAPFDNFRATAGWRLAAPPTTFNAELSSVIPTEWAGLAVSYK